jgi:hypothetical protein
VSERPDDVRPYIHIHVRDLPTMTMQVECAPTMPSVDYALNMLATATRMLEAERRKQEALDLMREQQENARVAQLITRPTQ